MKSQFGTSSLRTHGGVRKIPYVFTEQGVAMLSSVLHTDDETYHDRYFIIDKKVIYHSGNSVNHIGYRKSSINKLEDVNVKKTVIEDIIKIIR